MTARENTYLFNGVERLNNIGIGYVQTKFRLYDPSVGRFSAIDPLANFIPGINPYQFGFNNPIYFNDPDGLFPIPNFLKRLFRGRFGDQASRQAKRSQRKNKARGGKRPGRGKKGSGGRGSGTPTNVKPPEDNRFFADRDPLQRKEVELHELSFPDLDINPVDTDPPRRDPIVRGRRVPPGSRVSFTERISFIAMTDKFSNPRMASKQLQDLIDVLLFNPSLRLHIVGNVTIRKSSTLIDGNSDTALDQEGFTLNGSSTNARGLMNSKAHAVRMFLINKGIGEGRITIGLGNVIRLRTDKNEGIGGKVGFTIKN